jgi:CheY-like chemotaxis protein
MRQSPLELPIASAFIDLGGDPNPNAIWPLSGDSDTPESRRRRSSVLVVDDEKLIVDTMVEILEGAGFEVIGAYDGMTALERVARRRPDYLLSDVLMPQMNGVELAIAIRKMYPTTRIMLFSGQAGISEILLEGQKQGFEFELIAKPIHPLKLVEYLKAQ